MNATTKIAYDQIKACVASGHQMITPNLFSHCYGRAATSAAFRCALRDGIIEIAYRSVINTPVYRGKGVGTAIVEKETAILQ